MGIKDLLPSLADVMVKDFPLAELKGKRVAVDASAWLHKAIFATAEESMDLDFEEHLLYVDFLITRTRNFRLCGVEPVLVFDGKRSCLKSDTNAKRSEERHTNMEQGHRLMGSMKKTTDPACKAKLRSEAIACFQRGMSVTTEVERHAIAAMRRLGVTVIVAPYEADSQLAYLCHIGYCEAVLTEDSDIVVYSALCQKSFPILYKFNTTGSAQQIECSRVFKTHQPPLNPDGSESTGRRSKFLASLKDFLGPSGRRMFVQMCVLAGCDYSDSVPGVGLQYAQQAVAKFKDADNDSRLGLIVDFWQTSGKKVPPGFLDRVKRAEALFYYHMVFDPRSKEIVHFTPPMLEGSPHPSPSNAPIVSRTLLDKLGSALDILRPNGFMRPPSECGTADICEGRLCRVEFTPIYPILPWEYPELAALVDQVPRSSAKSASWSLRRNLMSILKDQMASKSPPNRNIPPLRAREQPATTATSSKGGVKTAFGDRFSPAKSLTSTTATLCAVSSAVRPREKLSSPPKLPGAPVAAVSAVPYSPQPQARCKAVSKPEAIQSIVNSTTASTVDKSFVDETLGGEQNSIAVEIKADTTAPTQVSPRPVKRAPLADITSSNVKPLVELVLDSENSAPHSSPAVSKEDVVEKRRELAMFTPQVLRTEPVFAPVVVVEATPCNSGPNPHLTEDTMWPAANSNSQHSISPLDKVVDLSASPASTALSRPVNETSDCTISGGKRKRPEATLLPPSHPGFPAVVKISVDPRGGKRKKNAPVKTISVASITSFFAISTKQ